MFITHKYAVMALGVLIELPVLDAVVDNFRVNAPAPQICKNTPIVGVFGWEGANKVFWRFLRFNGCGLLRRARFP